MSKNYGQIYSMFADIFEYPSEELIKTVDQCISTVPDGCLKASVELKKFRNYFQETNQNKREEIYIGTFELSPVCYPYVGHYLFGNSYKRGAFLSKLKERYVSLGIILGTEVPDHFPIMLRFLSRISETIEGQILEKMCLIPSLKQMHKDLEKSVNPYLSVVSALLILTSYNEEDPEEIDPPISKEDLLECVN